MDQLRLLKRAVLGAIAEQCTDLTVAGAPARLHRSADGLRLEADLPDGSRGLVHLATIKHGLPVGAFAIAPSALVYGGVVRDVLQQLPLPGRHIAGLGAILSTGAVDPFPVYALDEPVIAAVTAHICDALVPLLVAFSGEWEVALQHTLQHPEEVDRPYSAATVLSLLAGPAAGGSVDLDRLAAGDARFWDRPLALAIPGWRDLVATHVPRRA